MNGCKEMAVRIGNGEKRFIQAVVDQFGKTEAEAEIILTVFKEHKAVKIDPVSGQFTLTHGELWNMDVMNNALETRQK